MADTTIKRIRIELNGSSQSLEQATARAEKSLEGFNKAQKKTASIAGKLGKILEYRLIRGGLSKIMQGLEEGKKAIDAYDKALNGLSASRASTLMKEMAENTTLLQNTLASLFMTVYASVQPAINALVEALRGAMNTINQVISALMGRQTYTKAVKGWNSVTEAAKAYKKQIFGFDELNILKAPDGASQDSAGGQFEESEINPFLKGIANIIDTEIKPRLQEVLSLVDWEGIASHVGAIGAGIAAWKVGSTLLSFVQTLANNPTFQLMAGITLFIAGVEGLEKAILNAIEQGLNGKTIGDIVLSSGAIILGGALIGKALGDAVLGGSIGAIVAGGMLLWNGIKIALEEGISPVSAFLILSGTTILGAVFGALSPAMSMGVGGLVGLAIGAAVALGLYIYKHWDEIKEKGATFLEALRTKFSEFKDRLINVWVKIKEGVTKRWTEAVETITEKFKSLKEKAEEFLQPVISLINKIKNGWNTVSDAIGGIGSKILGFANGGYPTTGDLFIANESGPELVGSFGNRTGVYNQEQFAGAMAAANAAVVQAVYAIGSQITGAVNDKPVPNFRIGDRDIYNASQRGATLAGSSLIKGGR